MIKSVADSLLLILVTKIELCYCFVQIVGAVIYSVLVAAFYVFLGFFLGNRIANISLLSVYSFVVSKLKKLYLFNFSSGHRILKNFCVEFIENFPFSGGFGYTFVR